MSATHFNSILLIGRIAEAPSLSHRSHGEDIYRLSLSVDRLSGKADTVSVHIRHSLLAANPLQIGDTVLIDGEVRSFNNKSGVGARLIISVFAKSICLSDEPPANACMLSGAICREPIYRRTPLGREICDVMLAVNRRYQKSDYIPCIAWGFNARLCADMAVGASLAFEGRLQSREYVKTTDEGQIQKTAYEVSIVTLLDEIGEE